MWQVTNLRWVNFFCSARRGQRSHDVTRLAGDLDIDLWDLDGLWHCDIVEAMDEGERTGQTGDTSGPVDPAQSAALTCSPGTVAGSARSGSWWS